MIKPNIFKNFLRSATGLLVVTSGLAVAEPLVQTTMSSRFLVRGETATLDIGILNGRPTQIPLPPTVADVKIEPMEPTRRPLPGRRFGLSLPFEVSSYKVGHHVIPSMTLKIDGVDVTTAPIDFTVFNPDDLKWTEATAGQQSFRYAAAVRTMKENPYEGEAVPVEIKLYVPEDLPVADWGIPEFERDGIACWRFEPSERNGATILGRRYIAVGYPSSMNATRSGPVSLGPVNLRLMTEQVVLDGFARRVYVAANLVIPRLNFEAKKLPEGAPDGFKNAVGKFTMTATTTQKEIREKDPLAVDVIVSGTGNLDGIAAPLPKDTEGWKIYESAAAQRGEERRLESGSVTFHQFMMPLGNKASVPSFKLVYFDPDLAQYKTIETPPIPLSMLPPAKSSVEAMPSGPPPAVNSPVETMSDILGLIQPQQLVLPASLAMPKWTWHAVAAALALLLIIRAAWIRVAPKLAIDPVVAARREALRELERTDSRDPRVFLRKAGHFIEQWLGNASANDPALHAILEERDATCYRVDPTVNEKADRNRRGAILKILRKAAWVWIAVAWFGFSGQGRAATDSQIQEKAQAAYDSAEYDRAIQLWLDAGPFERLSAETLYDIGNASYRMGSSGHAALYYRRALNRDSSLAEAHQNLRFIERKNGAISVKHENYQYVTTKLRLDTWKNFVWAGFWAVGIAILTCLATRDGAKVRIFAVVVMVLGPILSAIGAVGWHYYPDDSKFAAVEKQAVIVGEKAVLHVDASRTSPEVIDAPAGSLCEIIKERGRWAYVGFATKTRGWIPVEDIERVVPNTPQTPPKIQKPKADGRSA